jgi:hypothetical protein
MFSSYLEYRMIDEIQNHSDSEYYTQLAEPFRTELPKLFQFSVPLLNPDFCKAPCVKF